mgnify:CR=1 FL=1
MRTFTSIRNDIYHHNLSEYGDLINSKSPYTLIKAVYYIETASIFLFLTQSVIKSPNFITMLYVIAGVVGAFLLNSEQRDFFILGIFLVFTKGTFDWADGPLARYLNKTSFIGSVFDSYGAYLSDVAFRVAFLFYTLSYFPDLTYLFPILSFILLATDFRIFSDYQYLTLLSSTPENKNRQTLNGASVQSVNIDDNNLKKWYLRYVSFLDDRARSIDLLLLILVLDFVLSYDFSTFLLAISICIIVRAIIMYVAGVYFVFKVYKE